MGNGESLMEGENFREWLTRIRRLGRHKLCVDSATSCTHAGTAHHGSKSMDFWDVYRVAKLILDRDAALPCLFLQSYR
jgi:hypothetical protein